MANTIQDRRLEVLRSAPGDTWIALSEDESQIVATGNTYAEVVEKSEKAGHPDPLIVRTPKVWTSFSL
jgi:hypothetical protein